MGSMERAASSGRQKLRRLTQAYLTPVKKKPSIHLKALSEVDIIYARAQSLLLSYQSFTSGLFPRYSSDTERSHVRDTIYCALACWAASIAYHRLDDDRGRQTELRQSAVKAMRGILYSWMRQADRLERFKGNNSPEFALHSIFELKTGEATVSTEQYGHLQIDVVALYLITLVQMTSGGVQIIFTHSEVSFVQNLVFYIERAYRTPDFGMWEKGTRYNDGTRELHASSLGMTKAALEAINGFNLYGEIGTSGSVIYVDIDAHNRNRTTFETMLPRESNSKNTDAALIPTIGYPFFATHDRHLYDRTLDKCVRRLDGPYGMKRFLRDGYRTALEDRQKRFYDKHETCQFDGIECQWPLFYVFCFINHTLRGDLEAADEYWVKVRDLMVPDKEGTLVVPECYFVAEVYMPGERLSGGSQARFPVNPVDEGHFLFPQALHIIATLLRQQLVHGNELDPAYRHMPASQRPKIQSRHSAFQTDRAQRRDDAMSGDDGDGGTEGDPVAQIAIISESTRLQQMLSTYGIQTQTPHEVEPVQIWPSWRLVRVFECLGKHDALGLTGRPARPIGALGTSKIYRVFGDTVLCYPLLFEVSDFYMAADPAVLIDDIKRDLSFVTKRWKLAGRPTFCVVLKEENVRGDHFDKMLELLVALKNGYLDGMRVRVGRVQNLLSAGCMEHIDFANSTEVEFDVEPFLEVDQADSTYVSLRDINQSVCVVELDAHVLRADFARKTTEELKAAAVEAPPTALRTAAFALAELSKRFTGNFICADASVHVRLEKVYRQAEVWKMWWTVRFCSAMLRKTIDSLAPCVTSLLVRGKQLSVGVRGYKEMIVDKPLGPQQIAALMFESSPADEPQAGVMQQELLVACANLAATKPRLFEGILTIRVGWLIEALDLVLKYGVSAQPPASDSGAATTTTPAEPSHSSVYDLSPTEVKRLLIDLLSRSNWSQLTPLQQRQLNGALNRVPANFYNCVWKIMERTSGGIKIAQVELPQQPTLADMTPYEMTFALKIEELLSKINHPEYRQIMIELLSVVSTILDRNPELRFQGQVNMDELIQKAFRLFTDEHKVEDKQNMTPFYQLQCAGLNASASTYLARAVVDALLHHNGESVHDEMDEKQLTDTVLACSLQ